MDKKENKVLELAKDFAVDIITLCKENKLTTVVSNQILRCSTSIGANIHEANYAHSKADFVAKLQISLKECFETEYWLELLFRTNEITKNQFDNYRNKCGTIRRILIASINTAKENK